MAGLDRSRFMELLSRHGVAIIDLDDDEFADEMMAVAEIVQQLKGS